MALPSGPVPQLIGLILCRAVVPLWILVGAAFKMIEHTPKLLPQNIFDLAVKTMGLPAYEFLATLIALELLAVGVMIFLGRFARAMAIFMMSCFVLILIAEVAAGHTHCGCLGGFTPPIWLMMTIDGVLLLGVILFRPPAAGPAEASTPRRWPVAAALAFVLVGAVTSFAMVVPRNTSGDNPGGNPGGNPGHDPVAAVDHCDYEAGASENPHPLALPDLWYTPTDVTVWVGKRWCELELFQLQRQWPRDIDSGKHYVVFFSRLCDHCEEMFEYDLTDPNLARMVTSYEIPFERNRFPTEEDGIWNMPDTDVQMLQLPLGTEWILTPPLAFRIEDGIVTCVAEGDHFECLDLTREHDHEH